MLLLLIIIAFSISIITLLILKLYAWSIYISYFFGSILSLYLSVWLLTPRTEHNKEEFENMHCSKKVMKKNKKKEISYKDDSLKPLIETTKVMSVGMLFGLSEGKIVDGTEGCCRQIMSRVATRIDQFGMDGSKHFKNLVPDMITDVTSNVNTLIVNENKFLCFTDENCNLLNGFTPLVDTLMKVLGYLFLTFMAWKIIVYLMKSNDSIVKTVEETITNEKGEIKTTTYKRLNIKKSLVSVSMILIYTLTILFFVKPFDSGANATCIVDKSYYAVNGCFEKSCDETDFEMVNSANYIDKRCLSPDVLEISKLRGGLCCRVNDRVIYNPNKCRLYKKGACPSIGRNKTKNEKGLEIPIVTGILEAEPGFVFLDSCGGFGFFTRDVLQSCWEDRFYFATCPNDKIMTNEFSNNIHYALCGDQDASFLTRSDIAENDGTWGIAGTYKKSIKNFEITLGNFIDVDIEWTRDQDSLQGGTTPLLMNWFVRVHYTGTYNRFNHSGGPVCSVPGHLDLDNFLIVENRYVNKVDCLMPSKYDHLVMKHKSFGNSTNKIVEARITFLLMGEIEARLKFFGIEIDHFKSTGKLCKYRGSIKINNICYRRSNIKNNDVMMSNIVRGAIRDWTASNFGQIYNDYNTTYVFSALYPFGGLGEVSGYNWPAEEEQHYYVDGSGRPCDTVLNNNGSLRCNGERAYKSGLIRYPMYMMPEEIVTDCVLMNNVLDCKHDGNTTSVLCTRDGKNRANCRERFGREFRHNINEETVNEYSDTSLSISVTRFKNFDHDYIFKDLVELSYRCTWCICLLFGLIGVGYFVLLIVGLTVGLGFLNLHNLGWIGRKLKIKWSSLYKGDYKTTVCRYCCLTLYNESDRLKHNTFCSRNRCSYCICIEDKESTSYNEKMIWREVWAKQFNNKYELREHCKMHKYSRRSKPGGYIYVMKCMIVGYVMVSAMRGTVSQFVDNKVGLRNSHVGINITVPDRLLDCIGNECKLNGNFEAILPIIDGSGFILSGNNDGFSYRSNYIIKEPRLKTTCNYEYTSMEVIPLERRTSYVCYGGVSCNNLRDMVRLPLRNGEKETIVWDTDRPTRSLDCPISVVCANPLVNFGWLSAGCWTINSGTGLGMITYRGDGSKNVISVFNCRIDDVNFEVCENDSNCITVSSHSTDITAGSIHFENSLEGPISTEFRVGILHDSGSSKASMLVWDPPRLVENTDNTIFAFKSFGVPISDKCIFGSSYNGGSCTFEQRSMSPSASCNNFEPDINPRTLSASLNQLTRHINCNFEETMIDWTEMQVNRNITIEGFGTTYDTIDYSIPSLSLEGNNCQLGSTRIVVSDIEGIVMKRLEFSGRINSVKCEGYYNRNNMAKINFDLSGNRVGLIEMRCPDGVSDNCVINVENGNTCNITVILQGKYQCNVGGDRIELDCSNLIIDTPDFISGKTMGPSGSEFINTWESSLFWIFKTWWGITATVVISLLFAIIILVLVLYLLKMCKDLNSGSMMKKIE
jgi:hypothetical protein